MAELLHISNNTEPSRLNTTHTTPVKASSHNSASEKRDSVENLLLIEMAKGGWVKDDGILTQFTAEHPDQTYIGKSITQILTPPPVQKESVLYGPLCYIFQCISEKDGDFQWLNTSGYIPQGSYRNTDRNDNKSEIRPDLIALNKADHILFEESTLENKERKELFWDSVLSFCEIKPKDTEGEWLKARKQSALYARQVCTLLEINCIVIERNDNTQVIINHPGRRFVLCIIWCHPKFEIWNFDRAGGIVSGQYSIFNKNQKINKDSLNVLTRVLHSLSTFPPEYLGFDPSFSLSSRQYREKWNDDPFNGSYFDFPQRRPAVGLSICLLLACCR